MEHFAVSLLLVSVKMSLPPIDKSNETMILLPGPALPLQVLRKADGGSRGFGFVTYKDEISVEKCLVMQHQLGGRTVELKRAIKKEEMSGGGYGSSGGMAGGYGSSAGKAA